jgi:cell division protein FtsN
MPCRARMNTTNAGRKPSFKPFVLGLALGILVGMLGMYLHQSDKVHEQPLRCAAQAPTDCPPVEAKAAEPTVRPGKNPEDYQFYSALEKAPVTPVRPDLERPLPPPPSEGGRPAPPPAPAAPQARPIYLQVASFKAEADADALKARILLAGVQANVVPMEIADKGTYYRIRVGPFASEEELNKAKAQLDQGGIDLSGAFVVR